MFKRLTRYALTALLIGWGVSALAAKYVVDRSGDTTPVRSLSCFDVGAALANQQQATSNAYSAGHGGPAALFFFHDSDCVGRLREVGDTMTLNMKYYDGAANSTTVVSQSVTLAAIIEDETPDDISGLPVQRVLTYLGWVVCLCLGVVAGQQR